MKKIGIAVFSLMFIAVAYVGAQSVEVDFNGENTVKNGQAMEKFSIPEAFADIEYNIPAPKRDVKFDIESNTQSTYNGVTKEMLDNSIKTAIRHSERNKFNILEENFQKLLKNGTMEEKYNFVYDNKKSYDFPKRIVEFTAVENTFSQTKGATRICVGWSSKEVCVDKKTWAKVCSASTLVCVVLTLGKAPVCTGLAAACTFVAVWTPECVNVPYCTQWDNVIY